MQVTATATAAVAAPQPVIPAAYARYNSEGKSLGTEQPFNRQGSASAIKASLIAAGTAKRDVREKTREVLSGERTLAEQLAGAWLRGQCAAGFVPEYGRVNLKGTISTMRLVVVAETNADSVKDLEVDNAELSTRIDALVAEIEAIKAANAPKAIA